MKLIVSIVAITLLLIVLAAPIHSGFSWSNGGWTTDLANPKYGTHDWIGQHALDWLPVNEKQMIINNLATYVYGTELPDNANAIDGTGIGDTTKHHVYYYANATLRDDPAATRAQEEYDRALSYAEAGDWINTSKILGIMTHYIADLAVFGHVMGSNTDWGTEVHHSDYEDYVETRTDNYIDTFNSYLLFDGTLTNISAYDATLTLAFNTTFGDSGNYNCTWMDHNYNWSDSAFKNRCGESLNLAVNLVADVLHTLLQNTDNTPPVTTDDYDGSWQRTDITINLTAADAGSGVQETFYRINGGPILNLTYNGQAYITTEGRNNILEYWSKDNSGNVETTKTKYVRIDKSPPTGTIQINANTTYTNSINVALSLSGQDSVSGVGQTRLSNDNMTWTIWQVYSAAKPWTTETGDGEKTVYCQFKDAAGLQSTVYVDTIILDTNEPIITMPDQTPENPIDPPTSVEVAVNVTDLQSGIKTVKLTYRTNTSQTWNDITMAYNSTSNLYKYTILPQPANTLTNYRITAEDNAGNQKTLDNSGQYYTYTTLPEFSSGLFLVSLAGIFLLVALTSRKRLRARS